MDFALDQSLIFIETVVARHVIYMVSYCYEVVIYV